MIWYNYLSCKLVCYTVPASTKLALQEHLDPVRYILPDTMWWR